MITYPYSIIRKLLLIFVAGVLLFNSQTVKADPQIGRTATTDAACRFGITSPLGSIGYDIAGIGVGSYLDWGAGSNPSLPPGVEYIRVLRLRDDIYSATLANLPYWVEANPGSVWVVGNEPDTTYGGQDALVPEVYADRYYQLATIIRTLDPSAKIGFGSVVQPTPIRIRYLKRAWDRLVIDAGGSSYAASNMIDIWSIHAFILNEKKGGSGTGIPPGFEGDDWDAVPITDFTDTYSSAIFQDRVNAFRAWMVYMGERNKPLWITEYGSLMPPIDPPGGPDYVNVSDDITANFLLVSFDFMLSTTNEQTGLPGDGNRLVQRWFWYSLNEHRYTFGGSLFDPDNGKTLTVVGQAFKNYQAPAPAQPDLFPASLAIVPISYNEIPGLVNYRLFVTIGNAITADTGSRALMSIYEGDPGDGGTLIAGPITTGVIQRCGGKGMVTADWMGIQPLTQHTLFVTVTPDGVGDVDPSNNKASFTIFTRQLILTFQTFIHR